MSKKIQFKGGWWAEVKTEYSYGADTRIAGAWTFANDDAAFQRACMITLRECVSDAHLPDIDGNAVPFAHDMWEKVNGKMGRKILIDARAAWAKWSEDSDPKDMNLSSSDTPQE